ncbi:poly [ADP-ribose] polymerase tankyrase-1-like [Schistocerca gregaria]|uniref:poly [ADP-ribose] polymerase tankyrase-1-like n=1 Tax=Schistocerca gregaria TaxID=7010 RepID=UPI00211EF4CA|nr:poly [ADP-ribose] polymerase tankyrase-1-like [Schistocerca gregaria]
MEDAPAEAVRAQTHSTASVTGGETAPEQIDSIPSVTAAEAVPVQTHSIPGLKAAGAVRALTRSVPGLTDAGAINLLKGHLQLMAVQHTHSTPSVTADQGASTQNHSARSLEAAWAVRALTDSFPGLTGPGAINLLKGHLQLMAIQHSLALTEDKARELSQMNSRMIQMADDGMVEEVERLLMLGANVEAKEERYGWTALHPASIDGHLGVVQCLLRYGADVGARDSEGRTPLHWAARYGQLEVLEYLLENGGDVQAKDVEGQTPVHWAAKNGSLGALEALLESVVGAEDNNDDTPLHLAATWGYTEAALLLVRFGADLGAEGQEGLTPQQRAERWGHEGTAAALLAAASQTGVQQMSVD